MRQSFNWEWHGERRAGGLGGLWRCDRLERKNEGLREAAEIDHIVVRRKDGTVEMFRKTCGVREVDAAGIAAALAPLKERGEMAAFEEVREIVEALMNPVRGP